MKTGEFSGGRCRTERRTGLRAWAGATPVWSGPGRPDLHPDEVAPAQAPHIEFDEQPCTGSAVRPHSTIHSNAQA